MAIFRLVKGEIVDIDFTADDTRLVLGEIITGQEAPAATPLLNKRIASMHFQKVWQPIAMGPS